MTNEIITAGKELAKLDPNNTILIRAREWWASGQLSTYSNQDFDILNSIVAETTNIKMAIRKAVLDG